jgi:hypothetical protein
MGHEARRVEKPEGKDRSPFSFTSHVALNGRYDIIGHPVLQYGTGKWRRRHGKVFEYFWLQRSSPAAASIPQFSVQARILERQGIAAGHKIALTHRLALHKNCLTM